MARRTHTSARRRLALMTGMIVLGLGAGNAAAAQASAVSATVHLTNNTGCTLLKVAYWVDHGVTTIAPNPSIPRGTTDWWRTESNGVATGTEGHARYTTINCAYAPKNYGFVEVHWDNPYWGANSYDDAGTTYPFYVPHSGGGGYQASVFFYAQSWY
jgi:hypothetical protein